MLELQGVKKLQGESFPQAHGIKFYTATKTKEVDKEKIMCLW